MPVKIRLQRRGAKGMLITTSLLRQSCATRWQVYRKNRILQSKHQSFNRYTAIRSRCILQVGHNLPTPAEYSFFGRCIAEKHLLEGVKKGAFDEAEAENA